MTLTSTQKLESPEIVHQLSAAGCWRLMQIGFLAGISWWKPTNRQNSNHSFTWLKGDSALSCCFF